MTRPDVPAAFEWLAARQRFGVRLGLERMRSLLAAVGSPQQAFRSVHVGGTNGKGSTATVLSSILRAGGERVGVTVSPHLVHLTERVTIDGRAVSEDALVATLERLHPHAEALEATYFEVITAAALTLFARAGVDTAVLEVGLGGRFDATNAVDPVVSVVTGVALDHTAQLGDTVTKIAREKAGIFRRGVPAWTAAEGEALTVLQEEAAARGTMLRSLAHDAPFEVVDRGWDGIALTLTVPARLAVTSPLVGVHQARNVALAAAAAGALAASPGAVVDGVVGARWPGRLERLAYGGRWLVVDGAHNPDAAVALARALVGLEGRVAVLVLGLSADKDVRGVIAALAPLADRVVVTRAAASPRAMAPGTLAAIVKEELRVRSDPAAGGAPKVEIARDPASALDVAARIAAPGDTIVVAGSLFLVGEARALALGDRVDPGERWQ